MLWRAAGADGDLRPDSGPADTVLYRALLLALRRFLRTEGEGYLEDPNIASVGLGHKVTCGRRTPVLCVQFTVEEKRADLEGLAALGTTAVPRSIPLAGVVVPTDVVERASTSCGRTRPCEGTEAGGPGRPGPSSRATRHP